MERYVWAWFSLIVVGLGFLHPQPRPLVLEASPFRGAVVLNEVLAKQTCAYATADTNDEFIELYVRQTVDLSGWILSDGNVVDGDTDGAGGFTFVFPTGSVFQEGDYIVIWLGRNTGSPLTQAPEAAAQFYVNRSPTLTDDGDDLWLFDAQGRIVDYMAYGSGARINDQSALPPGMWGANALRSYVKGQSLAVSPDGTDADDGLYWERTTSGYAPGPTTEDTDPQTCGSYERISSAGKPNHPPPPPPVLSSSPWAGAVVINEVLASQTCSSALDEHDEFVELYVRQDVDLSGWVLSDGNIVHGETDGAGGFAFTFPPGSRFPAGSYVVVWIGTARDPLGIKDAPGAAAQFYVGESPKLNNTGDDLWLFDARGRLVDYMAYGFDAGINPQRRLPAGAWSEEAPLGATGQSIALVPNGWDMNSGGNWMRSGDAQPPGPWAQDVDPVTCQGRPRLSSVGRPNHCMARLPCTGYPRMPDASAGAPPVTPAVALPDTKVIHYRLVIPKLNLDTLILLVRTSGDSWDVSWLWDQVGLLENTGVPGWDGNAVLTAHRWLPSGMPGPFAYLDRLVYGDPITVTFGGISWTYYVVRKAIVTPDTEWPLLSPPGQWLTLITCHGYDPLRGEYRYRLVVQARR